MIPTDPLYLSTGERAENEAYRFRLQRAYMVMIRAYLRRHSQRSPVASSTADAEVSNA